MDDPHYTAVIDARGLSCPLPLLKARQGLMVLNSGDSLLILATDPDAERDFEEFCDIGGHELLSIEPAGEVLRIALKKG